MKTFFKIVLYLVVVVVIVVGAVLTYVSIALPNVGDAEEIVVEGTAEQIARGKYLANHVMLCMDCHAERDYSLFSAPPVPNTQGVGGERFDRTMGLPGVFISPNITPTGISDWTDGELFRLITTGVRKDGEPIFPVMPYQKYAHMDAEDIKSVIAYLRTLEPKETPDYEREIDFPMNFIIRTIPENADLRVIPSKVDAIKYGEYLTTAAACGECHTKFENGAFVGPYLGGGREFQFPNGMIVRSANLTKHETGIGSRSKSDFVNLFKSYSPDIYQPEKVGQDEFQTIMPWMMYAGMDTTDLEAIYDYLVSIEPVDNKVEKVTFAK
ncbi:cytochrome c [Echinicola sp. CAU 1574]|uniref:Cytochrome c n=1 Tax=Echinicola arenosa TaxID=2774144 RepID=A0ABR9AGW2_9BACT|nr:cytochrome c [Echinicola arenosa]MBD8488069.1 cytochrome c [Echinicola arenosa]